MGYRLGVDIGGAFTDLVGYDAETGDFVWVKGETTPSEPSAGVLNTIKKSGLDMSRVIMVIHGQTLVINSIITRDGARVGLLTTWGHRDILELQRANRRDMYNFRYKKPKPFVPRYLSIEIDERILGDGSELKPLRADEVRGAVKRLLNAGVESICISFLNSYANPSHEIEAARISQDVLKEEGLEGLPVTMAHEITREWGEYERTNTAVLNAFVKPKMVRYLSILEREIRGMGYGGSFFSMLSNGGMASFGFVKEFPIYSIESGPIAGVIGGIAIAELLGEKNVIILDGGSTTTKASLVENLTPKVHSEYFVGRDKFNPGYPVKVPVIEIEEVGNGGTSVAWIDEVGNLRVGPMAMGADPGPACYGKGGTEPTVTDAYVVNGLINPEYLLGGEMKIYRDLAVDAVGKIADHYGISVEEAAEGIVRIANENAANAIRIISVQKGYDPREFSLIAHGGSGPMFAPFIAEDLEIRKIIIPTIPPGVFSAWGMLLTDIRHDVIVTNVVKVEAGNVDSINRTYSEVDKRVTRIFEEEEGISAGELTVFHYADMRYKGQEHTVKVPIKTGTLEESDIPDIIEKFHVYHERAYSFRLPDSPVEIVNFHGVGIVKVRRPAIREVDAEGLSLDDAVKEHRNVFIHGDFVDMPVLDRRKIPVETGIEGPAILEDPTSTVLVLENQELVRDRYGNIIIRRG
ncbi:hydantoinase/oxoprolinase family protein [Thermococcus sp. 21S7]|uniref:hydantoinase/oxoprolinase family protein n=1 Tax=Thermococcus sp. 21S7 TaxID=1638221 RepID=UPI00143918A8|nr:hydantoinase/oxoprolinase family protein [Thermococcus sp. 21S7]NJE61717.1 hydantoinase/oxoprolinase family protein [Thermococcus sp. 21S7]